MILEVTEKEAYIHMYINIKKHRQLEELLQQAIYLPKLEIFELLEQKLLRKKFFKNWKERIKYNYYFSHAKEYSHYYWDCYDSDIYKITWKKLKCHSVPIEKGAKLYHLARPKHVEKILKEGLAPAKFSMDGVYYGAAKIFFSTQPIFSDDEEYVDGHLKNRVQVEITYDGSYSLFRDLEYDHIENHPMVFTIIDENIKVDGMAIVQPSKNNKNDLILNILNKKKKDPISV